MPEQFPLVLLDAHALVGKIIEQLGKRSGTGRQLGRERQQAERSLRQAHLRAVMPHAIVETGTPRTERQAPPPVRTVGPLEHFGQAGHVGK